MTFLSEHNSNSFCKAAWLQHYTSTLSAAHYPLRITHEPNRQWPAVSACVTWHLEASMILEPLEKAGAISFIIICERLSVLVWCYLSRRWRRTYGGAMTRVYTPDKNSSAAVNMLRESSSGIRSRWWRCRHWAEVCSAEWHLFIFSLLVFIQSQVHIWYGIRLTWGLLKISCVIMQNQQSRISYVNTD